MDDAAGHGLITSRMHGALVKLAVEVGQRVRKGEFVLAIEAMKMEHRIEAPDRRHRGRGRRRAPARRWRPGRMLVRIEADAA